MTCSYRGRDAVLTPLEVEKNMTFIDPDHRLAKMEIEISEARQNGRMDIRPLYTETTKG